MYYCKNCGKELNPDMKFCPICGKVIEQENLKPPKKKKSKWWIALIVIVVVIAGAVATMFALKQNRHKKYETSLEQGDKYLEELDYENAEAKYLAAIDIEPKEKEPYMKLADIYMNQESQEKAVEILEKGIKNTEDKELQERYNLYTYVENVLIPEIGRCEEGDYKYDYTETINTHTLEELNEGVLAWDIRDYDNDGEEELLVLVMKKQDHMQENEEQLRNGIYLQMYENESGEIIQKDEYRGMYPILGYTDEEADNIFLKKLGDQIYICGSSDARACLVANGTIFTSFIITYTDGEFVKIVNTENPVQGSTFWNYTYSQEIANEMDEIGMSKSAEKVRQTYIPVFDSEDTVDKMLLKITGENEGFDREKWTASNGMSGMGKVVLKLQYSDFKEDEKIEVIDRNKIVDASKNETKENTENSQKPDSSETNTIEKKYEYSKGEFLSDFMISGDGNSKRASLLFWHNYGESASDEDFFFDWDDSKDEYDIVGNRSKQLFRLHFEYTDDGIFIDVTCLDGTCYSMETGQLSDNGKLISANYTYVE